MYNYNEELLKLDEIAVLLKTSRNTAKRFLASHHIEPICLGIGRAKGNRWLKSTILGFLRDLELKAQKHEHCQSSKPPKPKFVKSILADMTNKEILALCQQSQPIQ